MAEHSELPWRGAKGGYIYAKDGPNHEVQVGKIGDFYDKEIAPFNRDRWQADVDLIVKAVNNHGALVAALTECAMRCRYDGDLFDDQGNEQRRDASWKAMEMANAVLAVVGGASK